MRLYRYSRMCRCLPFAALVLAILIPSTAPASRAFVEADWLKQAEASTHGDAAGAVDGVKNGRYGFHTGSEVNPWWQVDLGEPASIARIVVYNRLDYVPGLHIPDNILILSSDEGTKWSECYRNPGKFFGGFSGEKPLEVSFPPGQLRARFVRLQIPGSASTYFYLDEVEIYGSADVGKNLALGKSADQSSISPWSVKRSVVLAAGPTDGVIRRGRRLAADLRGIGADTAPLERELDVVAGRLKDTPATAPDEARRELYFQARRIVRRLAFSNPLLNFDKLIFVKRFTQETYPDVCLNHMPWVSRPGGDICILSNWKTEGEPEVKALLKRALGPGHVHGMDLWWDGSRVVFGYAKAKSDQPPPGFPGRLGHDARLSEEPTHIFEIRTDGTGLRQLTRDTFWSDLDPTYLPNGDIAFVSERCGCSLQCNQTPHDETSCNLYVMRPDGSGIKRLSVTKDGDYLPHTLDDGRIAYTRWEYLERGWANIQSIWTVRPDGTGADAVFKQHLNNPWALEDTRSIPRSGKLVSIATGHHTLAAGPVVIVDATRGMNNSAGIAIVTPGVNPPEGGMSGTPVPQGGVADRGGFYMHPWALSENTFLVAYGYGTQTDPNGYALYLIDVFGTKELIYRDPEISCFVPIPFRPRPVPPVLPSTLDPAKDYAVCTLANVSQGVPGVDPKRMRYLRISEGVMWPYSREFGGQRYEPEAYNLGWTPVRVLGTVPIEADGSAYFRVPADTAVYFQLLDENQMELRRERSFISFQPGESRSCVGCHESREETSHYAIQRTLATQREPSRPVPPPWGGDRAVSFLRDIQPLLDRQCVSCHSGLKPAGSLDLCGGQTANYNRAFDSLNAHKLIVRSPVMGDASISKPLEFGSHKSKLVQVLRDERHTKCTSLTSEDWLRLVTWIDANAPYNDGFVNKRVNPPVYDLATDTGLKDQLTAIQTRRCASCHKPEDVSRLDWIDLRQPRNSRFLVAPLDKAAGGNSKCTQATYKDTQDPDYQTVLALIEAAVKRAWDAPRRDLIAVKDCAGR